MVAADLEQHARLQVPCVELERLMPPETLDVVSGHLVVGQPAVSRRVNSAKHVLMRNWEVLTVDVPPPDVDNDDENATVAGLGTPGYGRGR